MASGEATDAQTASHPAPPHPANRRGGLVRVLIIIFVLGGALALVPWVRKELVSVSTDDAYVNGHVTFVAPRVAGQVTRVLVDNNNRVRKGDLLVELDKQPYQVKVDIATAAVETAKANVAAALADARGIEGQMRTMRFGLERSIEDVNNQVELLKSRVAMLDASKAELEKTSSDYQRALATGDSGGLSKEAIDHRRQAMIVSQAQVAQALQDVYQVRVSLGLPAVPPKDQALTSVPADIDQTFSSVKEAQAKLIEAAAKLGVFGSFDQTPHEMLEAFRKRDPSGNIDKIYDELLGEAPTVKQARARLLEAERELEQAKLNLSYCDVVAEIDGAVTRRNVNPGNNVVAGQSLMAVRSLTEIWVDANFKETQLSSLRIGQPVELIVDMYGDSKLFRGRITGFTMGTGSTLALLPAENATGNFVKVVQRLPVRIDITDYNPDDTPLFVGLSVTPRVWLNRPLSGPNAGRVLQPTLSPQQLDNKLEGERSETDK